MDKQALYVISYLGRDQFVWAASAAEARAKAAAPRPPIALETSYQHAVAIDGPRAALSERRARQEEYVR